MKNTLRALFGVSALAFALVATPVLAAEVNVDVTSENVQTGADSDNDNRVDYDNDGAVNVLNDGYTDNYAWAKVNTGKNEQEKNTSVDGGTTTGLADVSTEWENVVNDGVGLCGCPVGDNETTIIADFSNRITGAETENDNRLDVDMDGETTVSNIATIINSLGLNANTGKNEQNKNTTIKDGMETGGVTLNSMISNWANSSDDNSSHEGSSLTVDVTASNRLTGYKSDNNNKVDVDADGDTTVTNVATIYNSTYVKANTGKNEQNKNTSVEGGLRTGNIEVSTDIVNKANSGDCCPVGKSLEVTADLSNETTGYKSDNNNKVDVEADGDTTVTNVATVINDLNVNANTGKNEQNMNTSVEDGTHTGDVSINFNVSNEVN